MDFIKIVKRFQKTARKIQKTFSDWYTNGKTTNGNERKFIRLNSGNLKED